MWANKKEGAKTYNPEKEIAKNHIEKNKEIITNKIDDLLSEFVNSKNYSSSYSTFESFIGGQFADLFYSMLEEKFKNKK